MIRHLAMAAALATAALAAFGEGGGSIEDLAAQATDPTAQLMSFQLNDAGGRIVHERWDSNTGSGEYSVIVGDRFSVEVSGNAPSVDALKSALVAGVNLGDLETVAREAKPAS